MLRSRLLLVAALTGCASTSSTASPELPPAVLTAGQSATIRVAEHEEAQRSQVAASPEEVWGVLPEVFEALDVPVEHVDSRARLIGNRNHRVSRTLGGEPLHRYLNCGSSMTGPLTSTHTVRLSLLVQVLDGEEGTAQVQTLVEGDARSRQGASGAGPIVCATTGRLESRILEMLNQALDR